MSETIKMKKSIYDILVRLLSNRAYPYQRRYWKR